MADEAIGERLREYLRELKPEARDLLAEELERALLRGEEPPAASLILAELRNEARKSGHKLTRRATPQRVFFDLLEPFLVDDAPAHKHQGRVSRACLEPIWAWICRDLVPQQATSYTDQVSFLLAGGEAEGAEQAAHAFQDLTAQRVSEVLAATQSEKALQRLAGQIGTPNALENVREIGAIFRARDALGEIASRLPSRISNFAAEDLAEVRATLDSLGSRDREVFLYALLVVMSRLDSPWQLIRLPIRSADSDIAARIAESRYAVAVDIVLTNIQCDIAALPAALRAGRGDEVTSLLKGLRDAARALHTEIDLPFDSPWGRQLAASRAKVSKLLQTEIENVPGQVRRLLRPRTGRQTCAFALDQGDVADLEAKIALAVACRNYAGELAVSETTQQVHSELKSFFDGEIPLLLDRLRAAPLAERIIRQAQVDAAVRFCAAFFGPEFATTLARAAELAAKGEHKTARA